ISFDLEKTDQENTAAGDKDIKQPSSNQSIQPEIQDQSVWGNRTDGDLIRTQPQRLAQPNPSALERGEEESGKIQNGHAGLSNGMKILVIKLSLDYGKEKIFFAFSYSLPKAAFFFFLLKRQGMNISGTPHLFVMQTESRSDCCVHCILACLFCEFLSLCNIVLGQASCGICTSEACCCCCGDEMGDDCNCPCDMDCGIMDACCESSDCLEICMECCGICFPS
ncbi:MDFIC protein, partial [Balaeniceps rex]|nr:MDFIC protein [Balaeniceps rex]